MTPTNDGPFLIGGLPYREPPEKHLALIEEWLTSNGALRGEVGWGPYPLGMVTRWIERAERAEADLAALEGEVSLVYDHVTGGRLSKPNTAAIAIISVAGEEIQRQCHAAGPARQTFKVIGEHAKNCWAIRDTQAGDMANPWGWDTLIEDPWLLTAQASCAGDGCNAVLEIYLGEVPHA